MGNADMQTAKRNVMRHLPAISMYGYVGGRQVYALWALEWAGQTFFWIQ